MTCPNQGKYAPKHKEDRAPVQLNWSPIPFLARVFRVRQWRVFWLPGLHSRFHRRPSHSCGTAPALHRLPPLDLASGPMVTAAEAIQLSNPGGSHAAYLTC